MTRDLKRFWIPFAAASAAWVLAGAWSIGAPNAHRRMTELAKLGLRGGQDGCEPVNGNCLNGCVGDSGSCDTMGPGGCSAKGDPCGTFNFNGSNTLECKANSGSMTGCASDDAAVKCYDVTNCVCGDVVKDPNAKCATDGDPLRFDTHECISGN